MGCRAATGCMWVGAVPAETSDWVSRLFFPFSRFFFNFHLNIQCSFHVRTDHRNSISDSEGNRIFSDCSPKNEEHRRQLVCQLVCPRVRTRHVCVALFRDNFSFNAPTPSSDFGFVDCPCDRAGLRGHRQQRSTTGRVCRRHHPQVRSIVVCSCPRTGAPPHLSRPLAIATMAMESLFFLSQVARSRAHGTPAPSLIRSPIL